MALFLLNHMPTLAAVFIFGGFGLMVMFLNYLSNHR
jgi:hypothetical protein